MDASFETRMNEALQKLASDIIPSDERLKKADEVSHNSFVHFS